MNDHTCSNDLVLSGGDAVGIYSLTTQTFVISCWNTQLVTDLELLDDSSFLAGMAQGCLAQLPFPDPNEFSQEARDDTDGPENSTVIMDPPIRTYEGHTDGVYKVSFT